MTSAASIAKVRILVQVTDVTLDDTTIQFCLDEQGGDLYYAAAMAADLMAAQSATSVDRRVEDIQVSGSQTSTNYTALAKRLRSMADMRSVMPYAGGLSDSDKESREEDDDRVKPSFTRSLHSYSGLDTVPGDDE
jgi:hypothetical protein